MKRVLLFCMIALMTVACSKDDIELRDANESYSLVYTTQELPEFVTVYAGSEINYSDSFEFIDSQYDEDNNTIVIDTQPGPIKIESNFYIENGSEVSIILYDSGGNIVDERIISQVNYNYIYEF